MGSSLACHITAQSSMRSRVRDADLSIRAYFRNTSCGVGHMCEEDTIEAEKRGCWAGPANRKHEFEYKGE
jgi:hypothetical protein